MISCGEGDGAARVHTRAGRRSAGLGGKGGARAHAHAVGVRASGERAICSVRVHRWSFDGAKIRKMWAVVWILGVYYDSTR